MIALAGLEPDIFYWATFRKSADPTPQVVRLSTEFGEDREFWTVLAVGSDQHYMPDDFTFLAQVDLPAWSDFQQAAE